MNYEKNIEIINGLEKELKGIAGEGPFTCEIKGSGRVSKEEFARWMVNEKNNDNWVGGVFSSGQKNEFDDKKQVEKPKERIVFGASGDIDGLTYFTERTGKDGVIKESYYQPRSEEEKEQIKKRQEENRKRREQEKSQTEKPENKQRKVENQELLGVKDNDNNQVDYKTWTQEQLIAEISRLKTENEALKNNQTLTDTEKENRVKQNQQQLAKLESNVLNSSVSSPESKNDNSKSESPNGIGIKGWIGVIGIVGLLGLAVSIAVKNQRKRDKRALN